MRIGLIAPPWVPVPPPQYGGTEAIVDRLARGFVQAGHQVTLFTTGDSTCPVPRAWVYARAHPAMGQVVVEARHLVHAYEAVADCDVVHDHTVLGPLYAAHRYPQLPLVTTNHGPFGGDLGDVYAAVVVRVAIVAISHAQRAEAPHLPVARVIHHGLDADEFPVGDGSGGYLLFLGRMSPEKGPHRAIDVARHAGLPLLIVAKMREPAEEAYFAEAVRPRLGPGVEYRGEASREATLALLGGAVALVNPIRWPEPFGLVMIEALACGTPVLAFPEGAAPEIVTPGRTGFLCRDEEDMAVAARRVASLDRVACRASVEGQFSSRRMVAEHLDLYHELLTRTRQQAGRPRLVPASALRGEPTRTGLPAGPRRDAPPVASRAAYRDPVVGRMATAEGAGSLCRSRGVEAEDGVVQPARRNEDVMTNDCGAPDSPSGTLPAGLLESCPECGTHLLRPVSDGELTNFLCLACGCCWHIELGWVHRVDPSTCPGCPSRPVCLASRQPHHPRNPAETLTLSAT